MNTLAFPGTVEEIRQLPKGPQIAAFFDLDGTLVAGFTATHLSKERLRRGEVGFRELQQTVATAIAAARGRADFSDLLRVGGEGLRGQRDADLLAMGQRLFGSRIVNLLHPEMLDLVRAHQRQGHTVVLASSATHYQVQPVADFLGITHTLCNRFVADNGILTGNIVTPVLWGKGKALAAQHFAHEHGFELLDCFFYADGDEDLALMHMVGHPRPINPGKHLTKVAVRRGWPIQRFTSRRLNSGLRSLAGVAGIFPIAGAGLALGLVRRDKRAGLNFTVPNWLRTMFRINGVTLKVSGRENLWQQRPAVFIFNHRNNFDAFMAIMLVERDFTGVGKKELENHWLMGTLGKLGDVAYIDRSDTKTTLEQLQPIEDAARRGLSIVISPEGTRHDTREVGPFKKGAFRMAMAAGLPIVPIVFRNAESVAARDSGTLSPGTVDVTVLPPIPVADWQLASLDEHIASVRQLYLDTLANWPE